MRTVVILLLGRQLTLESNQDRTQLRIPVNVRGTEHADKSAQFVGEGVGGVGVVRG